MAKKLSSLRPYLNNLWSAIGSVVGLSTVTAIDRQLVIAERTGFFRDDLARCALHRQIAVGTMIKVTDGGID